MATAVLLVEAMRADPAIDAAERNTVVAALRNKFALADDELARLVELAEQTAKSAYDYHRFTSSLNEHFTQAQKIQVIENMWQVAYADTHLDAHENHLISKIAGLLYVTHGEYIVAKMRAKEAAGQA
ncbi:TerB family tellurite resistance protein [Polaromonas sp. P1-6]|nr:TerB family tellurite resistance protein [Polaromonas sp. P1-6]